MQRSHRFGFAVVVVMMSSVMFLHFIRTGKQSEDVETSQSGLRTQPAMSSSSNPQDSTLSSGELYKKIDQAVKPFTGRGPKHVIILAYQRVGSSFFGQLFGINPNVFYIFEPLDAVYSEMYGTSDGWNVPSDITHYANGSARHVPEAEKRAVLEHLQRILACKSSEFPAGYVLHMYWSMFPGWEDYKLCLKNLHIELRNKCRSRTIAPLCPHRIGLNITAQEVCRDNLAAANVSSENVFGEYRRCLRTSVQKANSCVDIIQQKCDNTTLRVIKTVRGTMSEMESLLVDNPDTRVIHLLRDPRPVVVSRLAWPTFRGIYAGAVSTNHAGDLVKEAELYCDTVIRDLASLDSFRQDLQIRVVRVIYEDFIQYPVQYVESVYKYLAEDLPQDLRSWVKSKTRTPSGNNYTDKWRAHMSTEIEQHIKQACASFYERIEYNWPK